MFKYLQIFDTPVLPYYVILGSVDCRVFFITHITILLIMMMIEDAAELARRERSDAPLRGVFIFSDATDSAMIIRNNGIIELVWW